MSPRLAIYEQMSVLSDRMVAAAVDNDWDRLVADERAMAALREQLRATEEKVGAGVTARAVDDARDAERELILIRKLLDDAAEIRRHVEPWMTHVGELLGNRQRRRDLARAYAASDDAAST